jgi:hypothetical protein
MAVSIAVSARDGRDFAGYFSLVDAHPQGGRAEVTLRIQLYNHSGSVINDATVAVHQSGAGDDPVLTFAPTHLWQDGKDIILGGTVTVDRDVLERWSGHDHPFLFVYYTDQQGQPRRETADLIRRPQVP